MTTPNSPDNIESSETTSPRISEQKNMHELASEAVEDSVGEYRYKEADLLARMKNDPSGLLADTRSAMRSVFVENPSGYVGFGEDDITNTSKLSDKSILELYRKILITLQESQESLERSVFSLCKKEAFDTRTPTGRTNSQDLQTWIASKNESEIGYLIKSKSKLEKLLRRECFGEKLNSMLLDETESSFFNELGINLDNLSDKEKELLQKLGGNGEYFTIQDARTIIQMIAHADAPSDKKRSVKEKFLKKYVTEFSLAELIQYRVIDEITARNEAKKRVSQWMHDPDYFTSGTSEEQLERTKWFNSTFKTLKTLVRLPAETVLHDGDLVDRLFEHGSAGNESILEKRFQQEVSEDLSERKRSHFEDPNFNTTIDPNDWHGSFKRGLKGVKASNGANKVQGADDLTVGSLIEIKFKDGTTSYLRVEATDVECPGVVGGRMMTDADGNKVPIQHKGMRLTDLTREGGLAPNGYQSLPKDFSYSKLMSEYGSEDVSKISISSPSEFEARKTDATRQDHIPTKFTDEDTIIDRTALESALGFELKENHVHETDKIDGQVSYFLLKKIESDSVVVNDGHADYTISFQKFAELQKSLGIKEGKSFKGLDDFLSMAKGLDGLGNLSIEGGDFHIVEEEIDATSKEEKKTKKSKKIEQFVNQDGEVLQIQSVNDNGVTFSYGKVSDWDEKQAKKPKIKLKGGLQTESLLTFFTDLEANGFRPYFSKSEEDQVDPDSNLPHMHGYALAKFFQGMSFSDMSKGFDIYKHAWEHKLEKNSKFNAAKFADRRLSWLMPESFRGQLKSEMYQTQNEAMEGIFKMLDETMSGKEARLYVRKKILLNSDARFEEVLAGILYLAKKTGQIYPEELSDLKESRVWFHQLTRTFGATSAAKRKELWDKAAAKSDKGEFAVESDIIERLLKGYEGIGLPIPPNIAPKFAGYISEGVKDQEEKGTKEVNMRSNIDQMNRYALSKLRVGEGYKAIGCLDRIYGKNGNPVKLNAIPFTLVMSNMHEYLGTDFAKKLHAQAVGQNIRSTHALTFGNDVKLAKLYRSMVYKAAQEVHRREHGATNILSDLTRIENLRKTIGHDSHADNPEDPQAKWIDSIYAFWMKYGDKLHPLLQMTDPYIEYQNQKGDPLARAYAGRVAGIAGMQRRRENIKETDTFGEGNWKFDHTPPMDFKNFMHFATKSINSTDKSMDQSVYDQSFAPAVLGALNALRNLSDSAFPGPPSEKRAFQKKMFQNYYITIMYYLRTRIKSVDFNGPRGSVGDQNYIRDLEMHGIGLTKEDFEYQRTIPADVAISADEKSEMNDEIISQYDQLRINQLFETFMSASPKAIRAPKKSGAVQDNVAKIVQRREPRMSGDAGSSGGDYSDGGGGDGGD